MVFYFGDALLLWSVQRLVQYIIEEHSKEANVLALAPIREHMRESKPSKRLQKHLIRGYLSLQHWSCKVRRACAVAEKQCTECARHLRPQTFSRNCTKPAAPPTTGASHVRHRHGCFAHFRYVELERKPPAVAAVCSTAAGVRRAGFPTPHISTQQGFCCTGFRPRKEPYKYMATRTLPLPLVTSAPSRRTLDPARPRVSCAAGAPLAAPVVTAFPTSAPVVSRRRAIGPPRSFSVSCCSDASGFLRSVRVLLPRTPATSGFGPSA